MRDRKSKTTSRQAVMARLEMRRRRRRSLCFGPTTTLDGRIRILLPNTLLSIIVLGLLLFSADPQFSVADMAPDGHCPIYLFAPFTMNGGPVPGFMGDREISRGSSYTAAAMLATQHFNERNTSLIPELEGISDCNVTLDIAKVFDTGYDSHISLQTVWKHLMKWTASPENETSAASEAALKTQQPFCGMVGPVSDYAAQDLNAIAFAANVPMVAAWRTQIVRDRSNRERMSASTYPDLVETSVILLSFLQLQGRDKYVAILYPFSDLGLQKRQALSVVLESTGVSYIAREYLVDLDGRLDSSPDSGTAGDLLQARSIETAVQSIYESGYRTMVIVVDDSDEDQALPLIADQVDKHGMNKDYFYMFFEPTEWTAMRQSENMAKMLGGGAFVMPISNFMNDNARSDDPITRSWTEQGAAFVQRLHELIPSDRSYDLVAEDFFQQPPKENNPNFNLPEYGSAFVYDAVVSVGFGACSAKRRTDGSVDGLDHATAIREADFVGWSGGRVRYGRPELERGGTRRGLDANWAAVNILPNGTGITVPASFFPNLSVPLKYGEIAWYTQNDYVFADGTTVPPYPLRTPGDQNYLPSTFRAIGLSFMIAVMLAAILAAVWVYACRAHRIIIASQPYLLYVVCIGTIIQSSSVVTISFDENAGWTEDRLTRLCNFLPWLLATGSMVVVGALYTKLWRVHRTLQFSRVKVKLSHVAFPMIGLGLLVLVILGLQTAYAPLEWTREEDDLTGDSIGTCVASKALKAWLIPLLLVDMAATGLLAYAAYKTRDVDEAFSESSWIFALLCTQFEIVLIGIPIVMRLHDAEPKNNYLVFVMLILALPASTLVLIFGPKLKHWFDDVRGIQDDAPKRGQRAGVRVTGISTDRHNGSSTGDALGSNAFAGQG